MKLPASMNLASLDMVDGTPCVYALLDGEECVYVGMSQNLLVRVGSHIPGKQFTSWAYMPMQSNWHARYAEALLISIISPKYNVLHPQIIADFGTEDSFSFTNPPARHFSPEPDCDYLISGAPDAGRFIGVDANAFRRMMKGGIIPPAEDHRQVRNKLVPMWKASTLAKVYHDLTANLNIP